MSPVIASKPGVLQEQALERVHRVGEGIDRRDRLHPGGKSLPRVDGAAREIEHGVQHAEDRARQQRIVDAHHDAETSC